MVIKIIFYITTVLIWEIIYLIMRKAFLKHNSLKKNKKKIKFYIATISIWTNLIKHTKWDCKLCVHKREKWITFYIAATSIWEIIY